MSFNFLKNILLNQFNQFDTQYYVINLFLSIEYLKILAFIILFISLCYIL